MFKKRGLLKEEKGFFANQKLWMAAATLMGTIVGAGILGIPYVVAKVGFLYGFILTVLIGVVFIFLNLFAGEIVLRTKEQYQLTAYAEKYLGKMGKKLMTFLMCFSIYGALTAYLIGEGTTLHRLFGWGQPLFYTLFFFAIGFFIVYRGVKAAGKVELLLIVLLLLIVILTGIFSFHQLNWNNLTTMNWTKIFLPYGILLFAFVGTPAIPEMQEELGKDKKKMKKAIIIGSVIPIIIYVLFTVIIMGLVGLDQFELLEPNQRIATIALSLYAQPFLGALANILAVLSMFTSFLALGIALSEIYEYDYKFSHLKALILTFSLPLIMVSFNLVNFIAVVGITGVVAGGLDGILITLMYWKAKKLGNRIPEYSLPKYKVLGTIIIIMCVVGIAYQIWSNFLS